MSNELLKNISTTFLRQIISGLLQILILSLIANIYGPTGNGIFAQVILLPTILMTLLNFGVGSACVYYINSKKIEKENVLLAIYEIFKFQIVLAYVIGFFVIIIFKDTVFSDISLQLLISSLVFFPFILLSNLTSCYFQAIQDFKTYNFLSIIQPIIFISLIFLGLIFEKNITYIVIFYFTSILIIQIFALKKIDISKFSFNKSNKIEKSLILKYGLKSHASNILAFINYKADLFIISYFLDSTLVGIYVVAVTLCETLWLISSSVSTIILPVLSSLGGNNRKEDLLASTISRIVIWITFIASLILILTLRYILELAFSQQYSQVFDIAIILIPGIIFSSSSRILANDLAARGRPDLNIKTSWISVMINICLNFYLIPIYGLIGAAAATSISYTLNLLLRLYVHQAYTGIFFTKNLLIEKNDISVIFKTLKSILFKFI